MNSRILATTLTVLIAATMATQAMADTWTDYDDIGPDLLAYETAYPNLVQRYDLGLSVQGRHLWAIKISDNVSVEEDEPEFKYVSTMHGDEIVGTKMCMMLIDYLLTNYGTDPECTRIIDEVELWIVPLMNPDGYDRTSRRRYNANDQDLNRSFPEGSGTPDPNTTSGRPQEVAVIMNWTAQHTFTCSANFHGGALVANYPFDMDAGISSGSPAPSPDDDIFVQMALSYTTHNSTMYNSTEFVYGITNGSAWYSIDGGMQDWNYRYHNCNSMTLEIHSTKEPSSSQIASFWNLNRQAMIDYIENCLIGVRGVVTDATTGAPLEATVSVSDRDTVVVSDPDVGDYHRILLPGTYDLTFEVDGYEPLTITNVVVNSGDATRLDVQMAGPPVLSSPNGGETLTAGTPVTISWTGSPVGQFQVQYAANYGQTGTQTDGFERADLASSYETGGNANWFIQIGGSHSGARTARTGDIDDGQQTWMTRVAGEGSLNFWYRVSCEPTYDKFRFLVDGTAKMETWGNKSWRYYSTTLGAGEHLLKWEFEKDDAGSYYEDAVFIDDFTMTGDITDWVDIVTLTDPGTTSVTWTPPAASTDYKVRVRQYYAAGSYSSWDESDAVFSAVDGPDGDADDDDDVDVIDFAAFQVCFGTTSDTACTEAFDFDDDNDVDITDYAAFEALLLGSGPGN